MAKYTEADLRIRTQFVNSHLLSMLKELFDHAQQYGSVPWSADKLWARVRATMVMAETDERY